MFSINKLELKRVADESGYPKDSLEKSLRLASILEFINHGPLRFERLALKGGTAIHFTVFPLLRLSVDIDLDLHQDIDRTTMLLKREQIAYMLKRYMTSEGYGLSERSRYSHSLDSFLFTYTNLSGNPENIKVEINYSNRCHILEPTQRVMSHRLLGDFSVLTLDVVELFASKICALIDRTTPRDVYDVSHMLSEQIIDHDQWPLLRKCCVFYLALSLDERNFETAMTEMRRRMAAMDYFVIKKSLLPVLSKKELFDIAIESERINLFMNDLFRLSDTENQFLEHFAKGIYHPEQLFDDVQIIRRIVNHPMVLWKVQSKQSD